MKRNIRGVRTGNKAVASIPLDERIGFILNTGTMEYEGVTDCGHLIVQDPRNSSIGYALNDGRALCYDCTDDITRASLTTLNRFVGYLSARKTITTWTGGHLATVQKVWVSAHLVRVQAVTPDGRKWHGSNAGEGMSIMLRAFKDHEV